MKLADELRGDAGTARLKAACERGFGVAFRALAPVAGGHSSWNYRAETSEGARHFVKVTSRESAARQLRCLGAIDSPLVPKLSFGGKTFELADRVVLATSWVDDAAPVDPEKLTADEMRALLDAYAELARGLPAGMIHGDLHCGNVLYRAGRVAAFVDFEMMRPGLPTEDLSRVFVHAMERTRFWRVIRHGRIFRNFATVVRESRYPERDWLAALERYFAHKRARRLAKASRHPLLLRFETGLRMPFYRKLVSIIKKEKGNRK